MILTAPLILVHRSRKPNMVVWFKHTNLESDRFSVSALVYSDVNNQHVKSERFAKCSYSPEKKENVVLPFHALVTNENSMQTFL